MFMVGFSGLECISCLLSCVVYKNKFFVSDGVDYCVKVCDD